MFNTQGILRPGVRIDDRKFSVGAIVQVSNLSGLTGVFTLGDRRKFDGPHVNRFQF